MQQAIPHWIPPPNTTTIRQLMRLSALPMSNMSTFCQPFQKPAWQSHQFVYHDILYLCRGSTQAYLSMNMLCSSDHPTHPLHSRDLSPLVINLSQATYTIKGSHVHWLKCQILSCLINERNANSGERHMDYEKTVCTWKTLILAPCKMVSSKSTGVYFQTKSHFYKYTKPTVNELGS